MSHLAVQPAHSIVPYGALRADRIISGSEPMFSTELEQEIIRLALQRNFLTAEQVELHAPPLRPTTTSGDLTVERGGQPPLATTSRRGVPKHGPRLDRLCRLGLLNDQQIEELNHDLHSAASTTEHSAVTVGENDPAALGRSGAVHVQLPLPEPLRRWTRYEISEVLGQGGMGLVYKARDRRLGRLVALKFIRLADPKLTQRFLGEARAQARITHDNICKVYEVDEVSGMPYIAMEYIDGHSILQLAERLSLVQKVQLMQTLAEALHAAHRLGIIHRDMKPQNVLVEEREGGKLRPVIMDFGLARDVRSRLNLTETGVVLGTPEYMSPEQARGNSGDLGVDGRTDVYSLGAMLYELLCGHPPFEGSTSVQVLISVINEEVVPLRQRNPTVPEVLETIVLKCLAKEAEDRYPTARALAEDLGRFVLGEPIVAQRSRSMPPPSPSQPAQLPLQSEIPRWLPVALAVSLLIVLAGLLVVGLQTRLQDRTMQHQQSEQRRIAELNHQRALQHALFMRSAYALPLHNIRREHEQIRAGLRSIEDEIAGLPPDTQGAAYFALGRGLMNLSDWDQAQAKLEAALQHGFAEPATHQALAVVFLAKYQQALDRLTLVASPPLIARHQKALAQEFLSKASQHIGLTGGLVSEAPSHLLALQQATSGQIEMALTSSERALNEAPWLPELPLFLAQLLRDHTRSTTQADPEGKRYKAYALKRASDAVTRAVDMARSNPLAYIEAARIRLDQWQLEGTAQPPEQDLYAQVLEACQQALIAQPDLALPHAIIARAELQQALLLAETPQDPQPSLHRAVAALAEATRLDPNQPAWALLANQITLLDLRLLTQRGKDSLPALLLALGRASKAAAAYPDWTDLSAQLAALHLLRAEVQAAQGQDPLPDLHHAKALLGSLSQGNLLDEAARQTQARVLLRIAEAGFAQGESPHEKLQAVYLTLEKRPEGTDTPPIGARELLFLAHQLEAQYQLAVDIDPTVQLKALLDLAKQELSRSPASEQGHVWQLRSLLLSAEHSLWSAQNPLPVFAALDAGLAAFAVAHPHSPALSLYQSRVAQLQAITWRKRGRSYEAPAQRALAALLQSPVPEAERLTRHIELANLYALLAELPPARTGQTFLRQGLHEISQALALAPGNPQALLAHGRLLVAGLAFSPPADRAAASQQALAPIAQALKTNPLLRRAAADSLERIGTRSPLP